MMEDKLPKIDTGQIKEEVEGDGRDREREWNGKQKNKHHITNNLNVSIEKVLACSFLKRFSHSIYRA